MTASNLQQQANFPFSKQRQSPSVKPALRGLIANLLHLHRTVSLTKISNHAHLWSETKLREDISPGLHNHLAMPLYSIDNIGAIKQLSLSLLGLGEDRIKLVKISQVSLHK